MQTTPLGMSAQFVPYEYMLLQPTRHQMNSACAPKKKESTITTEKKEDIQGCNKSSPDRLRDSTPEQIAKPSLLVFLRRRAWRI